MKVKMPLVMWDDEGHEEICCAHVASESTRDGVG
jgi:hypothetical protein